MGLSVVGSSSRTNFSGCWRFTKDFWDGRSVNIPFRDRVCPTRNHVPKGLYKGSPSHHPHTIPTKYPKKPAIDYGTPIPSSEVIDKCLAQIIQEFGLNEFKQEAVFRLEPKHKWHIYCTKRQENCDTDDLVYSYIHCLQQLKERLLVSSNYIGFCGIIPNDHDVRLCQALWIDLRCKSVKFVTKFIEQTGAELLIQLIQLTVYNDYVKREPNTEPLNMDFTPHHPFTTPLLKYLLCSLEMILLIPGGIRAVGESREAIDTLVGLLNGALIMTSLRSKAPKYANEKCRSSQVSLTPHNGHTNYLGVEKNYRKKVRAPVIPPILCPHPIASSLKSKICLILRTLVLTSGAEVQPLVMKAFSKVSALMGHRSRFERLFGDLNYHIKLVEYGKNGGPTAPLPTTTRPRTNETLPRPNFVTKCTTPTFLMGRGRSRRARPNLSHTKYEVNQVNGFKSPPSMSTDGRLPPYGNGISTGVSKNSTKFSFASIFNYSPMFVGCRPPPYGRSASVNSQDQMFDTPLAASVRIITTSNRSDSDFGIHRDPFTPSTIFTSSFAARGSSVGHDNTVYLHDDNRPLIGTGINTNGNGASLLLSHYAAAVLGLVNALISYGPGKDSLEYRLHLRYEISMLSIGEIFCALRSIGVEEKVENHIKMFEFIKRKDEELLNTAFNKIPINNDSPDQLFSLLNHNLGPRAGYNSMRSFLYHSLILMRVSSGVVDSVWEFLDKLIQYVVVKNDGERHSDIQQYHIQLPDFFDGFAPQKEMEDLKSTVKVLREDLEESYKYSLDVTKNVKDITAEKDELLRNFSTLTQKYENEVKSHQHADDTVKALTEKLNQIVIAQDEISKANAAGTSPPPLPCTPIPSVTMSITAQRDDGPSPAPENNQSVSHKSFDPPPPPPLPGKLPLKSTRLKPKFIPKTTLPLKSLNWTIIPESKLKNTIWAEMDESWIYREMDLDEFEQVFSAYHKPQPSQTAEDLTDGKFGSNVLVAKGNTSPKTTFYNPAGVLLSLIEGRRAQNCTILLSKLKVSNQDIEECILTLDPDNNLHKDMCEQLLKFVPTSEESVLLSEHSMEVDSFAKADRFLYDMSKVFRYEHKLECLNFKKRFKEKIQEIKSKIGIVSVASDDVTNELNSDTGLVNGDNCGAILRTILEITLAMGNYMNRGPRSNAFGFTVESLGKLSETKSSCSTNFNLLHYLVGFLEISLAKYKCFEPMMGSDGSSSGDHKSPKLTNTEVSSVLEKRLESVKPASKINLRDLASEICILNQGLNNIENELELHYEASYSIQPVLDFRDTFINSMTVFLNVSKLNFNQIQQSHKIMQQKHERLLQLLGEEMKRDNFCQDDVSMNVFAILDNFLISFKEATTEYHKFVKVEKMKENTSKQQLIQGSGTKKITPTTNTVQRGPSYIRKNIDKSFDYDGSNLPDSDTSINRYGRQSGTSEREINDLIQVLQSG